MWYSDWNGIQLLSLADHEINIRQQVRMAIFQSKQNRSRVFQLTEVLNVALSAVSLVLCPRSINFVLMRSRSRSAFQVLTTNHCTT